MSKGGSIKTPIRFLCLSILALSLGCRPAGAAPGGAASVLSEREYIVRQIVTLANEGPGRPEKQNIWLALVRDFAPYQDVLSMEVSPGDYTLVGDEYGNQYAEFDLSGQPAGTSQEIRVEYRVAVNEIAYDLSSCEGAMPEEFTRPELHIESGNPQIAALAEELSRGKNTPCEQARAFYDYIGDELVYTPNGENWGAQAALGSMGADCTEYASLLAALSRARGIPARYFEGLLYLDSQSDAFAATEHAWADVYLPPAGWAAMDPTLGQPPAARDAHFARYSPDHIIVTLGASPSVLRGSSYWTHLYWPGDSTRIRVSGEWEIERVK